MRYRPEVDGLRAIAVLSIIFYHAKIILFDKDLFKGGYLGVDIFFVISGYLITRIILSEIVSKGTFSFKYFYERRARRILPMLFFVIFVSIPFAWKKLLPLDFEEYAGSLISSILFFSNFFFYQTTTVYGADSSLLKPFLHTWSLGIEEQFYFFFPIFVLILMKFYKKYFLTILFLFFLLSLQFSNSMELRNPDLNFYLPISRFWELAAGSILAYREIYFKPFSENIGKQTLPTLGLFLIFYSIFIVFDANTPHPSFHTLYLIIGVCLIITFSSKDELIGKILGAKPLVLVGLISYSLYLWHYPIFAFSRLGGNQLDNLEKIFLILLTFFLSTLSFLFVEKPFRKKISTRLFVIIISASAFIFVLLSSYIIKSGGVISELRFGFNPSLISSAQPTYLIGDDSCNDQYAIYEGGSKFCSLGNNDKKDIDFILLGDSHAMSSEHLLNDISIQYNKKGLFGGNSGCLPLIGIYSFRGNPHPTNWSKKCYNFNQNGYELAKKNKIKYVILIARWDYYVDGSDKGELNNITDTSLEIGDVTHARRIYKEAIKNTLNLYSNIGTKVIVMLQVPHQNIDINPFLENLFNIESNSERKEMINKLVNNGINLDEHFSRQAIASSTWKKFSNEIYGENELYLIDPSEEFCNKLNCPIISENYSFYTDRDHASKIGFARLRKMFLNSLDLN